MRIELALLAILGPAVLGSCSGMLASRSFAATGDFQTSTPKSRAEGGHTPPVVPPRGVSWTVGVAAFDAGSDGAGDPSHYEMHLAMVDRETPPGTWRIAPVFEGAELVDDEGGRFPCTRALVPDLSPDAEIDRDAVPAREFTYVFDVPGSYLFRRISTLAVHWGFAVGGGEPVRVTTRFRGQ